MNAVKQLIDRLIDREGGYVDHPDDRGGPTKFGITLKTLSEWRKCPCTKHDVILLEVEEASEIYYQRYWIDPGFFTLTLSDVVVEMLFDTAVHSGPTGAVKMLQRAISVGDDGVLGPVTRGFANRLEQKTLAALFIGERIEFIGRLITRDHSQAVFAAGWMARMRDFVVQIPHA
jgi:lysozyme family protein